MRIGKILLIIIIAAVVAVAALLVYAGVSLRDQAGNIVDNTTPGQEAVEGNNNIIAVTPSAACVPINGTQRFSASVEGAQWSVKPLNQDGVFGTVSADGLFTAAGEIGWAEVVAVKGDAYGSASVVVVQDSDFCDANSAQFIPSGQENGESGGESGATTQEPPEESTATATGVNKWAASFDVELKYEVIGEGLAGYVTHKLNGGFWFIPEFESGKLTLAKPSGMVNVDISDDVAECDVTALNDTFMLVSGTDGKIEDTNLVFGKNFIITGHKEGLK
ncbi:MAG: hypothetical protein KKF93_07505, partial [Candidatus Omnitrophica bacterium]|nr:hypothetical protein [Candidatus Omnitrophota bacterium]